MTPSRFTSAAGREAVELKCLTQLESRSACRADAIEAAIVCGRNVELGGKQTENLEDLENPDWKSSGSRRGSRPQAANLGPGRATAVGVGPARRSHATTGTVRLSVRRGPFFRNRHCTIKGAMMGRVATKQLMDFDASCATQTLIPPDLSPHQNHHHLLPQPVANTFSPGPHMPGSPCALRSP